MDGGAWWVTVYAVAKNWTPLRTNTFTLTKAILPLLELNATDQKKIFFFEKKKKFCH